VDAMLDGTPLSASLDAALTRFWITEQKCAALAALAEGSPIVKLKHQLIALEQAEEWLGNMIWMMQQTSANAFSRAVDSIERFVARHDGQADLRAIYSFMNTTPVRVVDEYINQLVQQGRVSKEQVGGGHLALKSKTEREMEMAA